MNSFDFYRDTELDVSVVLNYPKGMTSVLTAMQDLLKGRGKYLIEEGSLNIARAREIVAKATGDTRAYYQIQTADPKVWSVLRESVNEDRIRVLAIFHGQIPDEVPENVITIDIGRSLHRKVPKPIASSLAEAATTKGKFPAGSPEELYYGVQAMCYEVLYSPEARVFPRNATNGIPKSHAWNFMYNPPSILTDATMTSAVHQFVEDLHGWMG